MTTPRLRWVTAQRTAISVGCHRAARSGSGRRALMATAPRLGAALHARRRLPADVESARRLLDGDQPTTPGAASSCS